MRTSTVSGTYYKSKLSKKRHLRSSRNDKISHRYKVIYNNNITGHRPPAEKDIMDPRVINKNKKNAGPRVINKNGKNTGPRAKDTNKRSNGLRADNKDNKKTG